MRANTSFTRGLFALVFSTAFIAPLNAQIRTPLPVPPLAELTSTVAPRVEMLGVDVARLLAEDSTRGKNEVFRYGARLPLVASPATHGAWITLENGDRMWRLEIVSRGAKSLSVVFDRFHLPPGAALWITDDESGRRLGAYTAVNNQADGSFGFEPFAGESLTLELFVPRDVLLPVDLRTQEVIHDYRGILNILNDPAKQGELGASGACEIDINCPPGVPFEKQKRAVAQILVGGGCCSGAMINNTRNDGDPLFITAHHCGPLNAAVFRFKYELSGCEFGTIYSYATLSGSQFLAGDAGADFRLVRLNHKPPATFNSFYLGWDRSGNTPGSTFTIHHPEGDVKKISFDNNSPAKTSNRWQILNWDVGVTEPGSSGGPLLDPVGRFIGQLWGGEAYCGHPINDYYGRFDQAWNLGAAAYLDPIGTGAVTLNGRDEGGSAGCGFEQIGVGIGGANTGVLAATGTPTPNSFITYSVSNMGTSGPALLFISPAKGNIPYGGGTFLIDLWQPQSINATIALVNGSAQLSLPVPPVAGATIYMQVIASTPLPNPKWVFSNAIMTTVCQCELQNTPSNLHVGAVTPSSIQLLWQDNSPDEVAYRVAKLDPGENPDNPAHWDNVGGDLPANTTSYVVTGLTDGAAYKFKVRAKSACGDYSAYSNVVNATPQCSAPAAPAGLTATSIGDGFVALSWVDQASNESVYRVAKLDPGEDPANPAHWDNIGGDLPANSVSFIASGLAGGGTYQFKVRCQNACGEYSDYSNTAIVTLPCSKPMAPTNLFGWANADGTIDLFWIDHAVDELHYRVAMLNPGEDPNNEGLWDNVSGNLPADTFFYTVGGLDSTKTYMFKVRCVNACGEYSDYSNILVVEAPCSPTPPAPYNCVAKRLTTTPAPDPIEVTWSYSGSPVSGFRIARLDPGKDENNPNHWHNVGGDLPYGITSYIDAANLVNGKTYKYKVRAFIDNFVCPIVYSAYSNIDAANP